VGVQCVSAHAYDSPMAQDLRGKVVFFLEPSKKLRMIMQTLTKPIYSGPAIMAFPIFPGLIALRSCGRLRLADPFSARWTRVYLFHVFKEFSGFHFFFWFLCFLFIFCFHFSLFVSFPFLFSVLFFSIFY
jgi:hypothetical protein